MKFDIVVLSALMLTGVHAQQSVVGSVKVVHGQATVVRGAQSLPCTEGMQVQARDVLKTQPDARIGLILHDGTRLSLGPNAEVSIEKFLYQPADRQFGLLLRLVRGAMAFVSGKIGAFMPDAVKVETPVGMVGLRGTEFAIALNQP